MYYCLASQGYFKVDPIKRANESSSEEADEIEKEKQTEQTQIFDPCQFKISSQSLTKILRVGSNKFVVCPPMLMKTSNYFKSMFSDFMANEMDCVDVDVPFPEIFEDMLFYLHFEKFADCPTNLNIVELLVNADYLEAHSMIHDLSGIIAQNWEIVRDHCPNFTFAIVPKHLLTMISSMISFGSPGQKVGFYFAWLKDYTATMMDREGISDLLESQLDIPQFSNLNENELGVIAENPDMVSRFWPNESKKRIRLKVSCMQCGKKYRLSEDEFTIPRATSGYPMPCNCHSGLKQF